MSIPPVKITQVEDLHRRQLQNDRAQRTPSPFGPNNEQNSRAQGSGSNCRTRESYAEYKAKKVCFFISN